jgi:AraC-like DNA-binding protein
VRLRQVLLNLLSNATKFTEKGEIVLGAQVVLPHLHLWVRDSGAGIPVALQERIFEPFGVVEQTNRVAKGIGLGLSIARHLVALHRGSMTLESQPGNGSTFHVYLPLPSLDDSLPAFSSSAQPVLLVLSSSEQPAAEIADFSQRQGLEIHRLCAGDDVDVALAGVRPAAIAWDLAGAGAGDWGVIQQLRSHSQLCRVPFVLYGGQGEQPAVGMTSFVIKPAGGASLLKALAGLCPAEVLRPILIVDDDAGARELYRSLVEKEFPACPVLTAANGVDAMALVRTQVPALVILDLVMPEMDGFEVLDHLRADARTRQVPVLILSGRMLTFDDVERIERHARVTVQSKGILSQGEIAVALHRALFDSDVLPPHTGALVKRAVAYFQQNYARPLSRQDVAGAIGVSERYLSRVFRRELGLTPWEYLNRYRIAQAKEILRSTSDSITAISLRVGFNDLSHFGRAFRKVTGLSPSAFRDLA